MANKKISFRDDLKLAFDILKFERKALWPYLTFAALSGLLYLSIPLATQTIVNSLAFTTVTFPLFFLSLLVFLLLLLAGAVRLSQRTLTEFIEERYFTRFTQSALSSLFRHGEFDEVLKKQTKTMWANRYFDILNFTKAFNIVAMDGLSLVLQGVIGLIILSFYHPYFFVFAFFLAAGLALLLYVPSKKIYNTGIEESGEKYETADFFEQIASVHEGFYEGHAGAFLSQKLNFHLKDYLEKRRAQFFAILRQKAGFLFFQAIMNALLLALGGWLVVNQQLTLGQLVAAELILNTLIGDYSKVSKVLESSYELLISLHKLRGFTPLLEDSIKDNNSLCGYKNFSVLKIIDRNKGESFEARVGSINRLEFASRTQKDEFFDALTGNLASKNFEVLADEVPAQTAFKDSFPSAICYLQKPFLMKGTLEQNLFLFSGKKADLDYKRIYAVVNKYWGQKLPLEQKVSDFQKESQYSTLVSFLRGLISDSQVLVIDQDFIDSLGKRAPHRFEMYRELASDKIVIEINDSESPEYSARMEPAQ